MAYQYFSDRELACKCPRIHTGGMDVSFMGKLVALRTFLGFPMPLSSAYRCPIHNMEVSNTGPDGPHTTRQAVDVKVYGIKAYAIIKVAPEFGFTGIGVNQKGPVDSRFIHLDTLTQMPHPRPWVWSY